MARRQNPSDYGDQYGQGYGSPYSGGGQDYGARGYGASDPYGAQGGYGQQGGYGAQGGYQDDAYAASEPYGASNPYGASSPYDDPYAQPQQPRQQRDARAAGRAQRQQPTAAYPAGSGRVHESSRPVNRAAGVQPAVPQGRASGSYGSPAGASGGKPPKSSKQMSRRAFIGVAGGALVAAVLGVAGVGWFTHRAVACTVNGASRQAPIGSSAADLIGRGYASPSAGNLVSICNEGEEPELLTRGGGNPYTLTVNGKQVDPATYKLKEGDALEFVDGTDVTEDIIVQNTEIPCGVQYPSDDKLLVSVGYVAQWGRNGVSTVETGAVSGKVVDRGVTQEPQDLVIAISGINPADGRRLVALTFDDGPDTTYAPQYLDILARYGARATFFNLGANVDSSGDAGKAVMQRILNEGHQLASHTYSHNVATLSGLSVEERNNDILKGFQAIENACGFQTNVMRPPYGEFRGYEYYQYLQSGHDIAYSCYWTVDSEDWERPGADAIVARCTNGLAANPEAYNGAIILMHDGGGDRTQDVAALPAVIEAFQAQGYELVTVNEMLAADPTFPEWVWSGNAVRPEGTVIP